MKLSNQALGALMMALQKCLLEEIDIVELLQDTDWVVDEHEELFVTNPPVVTLEDVEVNNVADFVNEVLTEEN
jgi:hypothetical protein|tara:strand:- start:737 stop:955 length:219 start_codon:yes stop_codon:yes gene_type:complete